MKRLLHICIGTCFKSAYLVFNKSFCSHHNDRDMIQQLGSPYLPAKVITIHHRHHDVCNHKVRYNIHRFVISFLTINCKIEIIFRIELTHLPPCHIRCIFNNQDARSICISTFIIIVWYWHIFVSNICHIILYSNMSGICRRIPDRDGNYEYRPFWWIAMHLHFTAHCLGCQFHKRQSHSASYIGGIVMSLIKRLEYLIFLFLSHSHSCITHI